MRPTILSVLDEHDVERRVLVADGEFISADDVYVGDLIKVRDRWVEVDEIEFESRDGDLDVRFHLTNGRELVQSRSLEVLVRQR